MYIPPLNIDKGPNKGIVTSEPSLPPLSAALDLVAKEGRVVGHFILGSKPLTENLKISGIRRYNKYFQYFFKKYFAFNQTYCAFHFVNIVPR